MLVGSGATTTAISASTSAAAGITIDERGFPEVISTANGAIAALPGVAAQVTIGGITARDLPVIVSPAFGDTNVIGMNFLSQLKARRVAGRAHVLIHVDYGSKSTTDSGESYVSTSECHVS